MVTIKSIFVEGKLFMVELGTALLQVISYILCVT